MIYLFTAIGLTAGGSSTVHIYTQTMHRTTQSTQTVYRTTQSTQRVHRTTQHNNINNYSTDWTIEGIGVPFLAGINIQSGAGGKVNILGGGTIGHCVKRKYCEPSSEISPTRCNNCVFILRNGFTLHVSGDNFTHHQEYNF